MVKVYKEYLDKQKEKEQLEQLEQQQKVEVELSPWEWLPLY
jgi:hypothetical protein